MTYCFELQIVCEDMVWREDVVFCHAMKQVQTRPSSLFPVVNYYYCPDRFREQLLTVSVKYYYFIFLYQACIGIIYIWL